MAQQPLLERKHSGVHFETVINVYSGIETYTLSFIGLTRIVLSSINMPPTLYTFTTKLRLGRLNPGPNPGIQIPNPKGVVVGEKGQNLAPAQTLWVELCFAPTKHIQPH